MKNIALIILFLMAGSITVSSQTLTVKWKFKNVEEGYSHDNKCVVYIDGDEVGESSVKSEDEPNSMKVKCSKGKHEVKIVNLAHYEGEWEEHTIDNGYSLDCVYETTLKMKKGATISLVFDIDEGTSGEVINK